MPTNVYFSSKVRSEQNLYEDLVIESLRMYGQDVYYLPRSVVTRDAILNEDVESQFDDAYMIEMYIEDTEAFGGEGNLLSKFGLEIRDEATFIVAKRTWERLVGNADGIINQGERPNEGDLIYLPLSNSFFEISFVEHEQPFYQLSNLPIYKLQARLFELNDEDFNTGVSDIDDINKEAFSIQLNIGNIAGSFIVGEIITQDFGAYSISARIVEYDKPNALISVVDLETSDGQFHSFTVGGSISGSLANGTANIVSINDIDDNYTQANAFESMGDNIIDFTENNPFGEP